MARASQGCVSQIPRFPWNSRSISNSSAALALRRSRPKKLWKVLMGAETCVSCANFTATIAQKRQFRRAVQLHKLPAPLAHGASRWNSERCRRSSACRAEPSTKAGLPGPQAKMGARWHP